MLKIHYLLEDFYYYSALAFSALDQIDEAHEMLYLCHCVLQIENNEAKRKSTINTLKVILIFLVLMSLSLLI